MKNRPIGIIGGMGPQASSELYRLLIKHANQDYGAVNNDDYPEIIMDSVPVPDFLGDTKKLNKATEMLKQRTELLTKCNVSVITMACNTACILSDKLQQQTQIPVVSIVEEVAKEVSQKKYAKVLLLASPTSLRLGLYQNMLNICGVKFIIPKKRHYKVLEDIIRGVLKGQRSRVLKKQLTLLADKYVTQYDVKAVVLGCTELPLVFPKKYRVPALNSLDILADSLLKSYYNS